MGKRLALGDFSLRACVFGFSEDFDMNNLSKATTEGASKASRLLTFAATLRKFWRRQLP